MVVSAKGHPEVVRLLVEKGAKVDAKDTEGKVALIYAEQAGNAEIVRLLKEAAAKQKVEARNK
jgi:ankyrin repeat protein